MTTDVDDVKVTPTDREKIEANSPSAKLPLNPTAQGYSGALILRLLSQAITGTSGSVLKLIEDKLDLLATILTEIDEAIAEKIDVSVDEFAEKAAPIATDLMIVADSANDFEIKKVAISQIFNKAFIGLENVDNVKQMQAVAGKTLGKIPVWGNANGALLDDGYVIETTLSGGVNAIPRADAVKAYFDGLYDELANIRALYKPKGSKTAAQLIEELLVEDNLGNVYNMSEDFTTTALFIEGAGIEYGAGSNVVIVEESVGVIKFDVLGSPIVDVSDYEDSLEWSEE